MRAFTRLDGLAAGLDRANVDTDQIIPKQFLRSVERTGFGPFLFDEWRYLDRGELGMDCESRPKNPDFVLNQPRSVGAEILLARDNFGCGSSREHAVWAMADWGFRAVVAPSFGDIFANNCVKNGLLPVRLTADEVEALFVAERGGELRMQIDLAAQTVGAIGRTFNFAIDSADKIRLLNGWDDIAITLRDADKIRDYEKRRLEAEPWLDIPPP